MAQFCKYSCCFGFAASFSPSHRHLGVSSKKSALAELAQVFWKMCSCTPSWLRQWWRFMQLDVICYRIPNLCAEVGRQPVSGAQRIVWSWHSSWDFIRQALVVGAIHTAEFHSVSCFSSVKHWYKAKERFINGGGGGGGGVRLNGLNFAQPIF